MSDAMGRSGVRVLLFLRTEDAVAVERGYHQISAALHGTPGLLRNELLRDLQDPRRFVVISEWESPEAFRSWEQGSTHRGTTAPLRQFQDQGRDRPFGVYEVAAAYTTS
jgi:heme-degrading monooxygenase HmoA